jgi:hypothetical protein
VIILSPQKRSAIAAAAAGALIGTAVTLHYHRLGLTLSHYDARGHLIVARRVIDSITPGWQQLGAVWLPLPHLLNLLPVQLDVFYRSGASAIAISVASFAAAVGVVVWIMYEITASLTASAAAGAVFALNPNVLYLQATPMTEPLLIVLTLAAVALLMRWCKQLRLDRGGALQRPVSSGLVGLAFLLACLTRYEAWPVTFSALPIAVCVLWRWGMPFASACRRVSVVAAYPAAAMAGFMLFSRVVIGEWFTSSGFFVPENKALGRPMEALAEIGWGVHALSGTAAMALAAVGLMWIAVMSLVRRPRAGHLLTLSLLAAAALPWAAFFDGHPFRIRYMVPLIAAEAIGVGAAAAMFRRATAVVAIASVMAIVFVERPLDSLAPMVLEAQWDRPNVQARQRVTDWLRTHRDGEKIMASMGSLGHYMQETSRDGFALRDFLHEGNGDIWLAALEGPKRYAGWILIEEKAEGGDMLAQIARKNPAFLDGYARVCEGAGVALYRRTATPPRP